MVDITSYDALAPMLSRQLRRGVRTNAFASAEDYRRELRAGTLQAEEFSGGLLLLRRRNGFARLSFYLCGDAFPEISAPLPLVTEIAARPRDPRTEETVSLLMDRGFRILFTRRRMMRPPGAPEAGASPLPAVIPETDPGDFASLLEACFDPKTGCLPTEDALEESLRHRELICISQNGTAGLLHWQAGKGSTELRHLAVRADCRRRGFGEALLRAYLTETASQKSLVWVRNGNTPAEALYEKHGYTPDGWHSTVLLKP